jgi:Cys-tRNA(Pro)/Cys-tRNA(Cys) deacylase
VTRLLDARGAKYLAFELPALKLGAMESARLLNVDPRTVFKTIVVEREKPKRPLLVLVSAIAEVDLKQVALAVGDKKVHLPTEREAEALTGLQAGGISPLALLNKGFKVLLDAAALEHSEIHVSGGQRGLNIRISVADFIEITGAHVASVSRLAEPPADSG